MWGFFLLYSHKIIKVTVVLGKVENSGHTPPLPSEPVGSAQLLFDSLCVPFELELIIFTFIFVNVVQVLREL